MLSFVSVVQPELQEDFVNRLLVKSHSLQCKPTVSFINTIADDRQSSSGPLNISQLPGMSAV